MFRNTLLAATLIAGFSGAAMAEQPLTVLGTGENFAVDYSNDGGNILGGGPVKIVGNGESISIQHAENGPAQRGRLPRVIGNGESARIVYTPAPTFDLQPRG